MVSRRTSDMFLGFQNILDDPAIRPRTLFLNFFKENPKNICRKHFALPDQFERPCGMAIVTCTLIEKIAVIKIDMIWIYFAF